jgi:putative hemolysin
MPGIDWAIIAALVLLNSVFAAYEIALASVSVMRLELLAQANRFGARSALLMKRGVEASLAVVQIGITLVGVMAAAVGGAGAQDKLAPLLESGLGLSRASAQAAAIVMVAAPLTLITIIVGELIPKVFALRNKEWVCLQLSPAMRGFALLVWPIVWFLEWTVRAALAFAERYLYRQNDAEVEHDACHLQELRATAAMARASRLIGAQEERIIVSAARLSSRPVAEIALPAEHISMLTLHDSLASALISAHLDLHTRFPVTNTAGDPQGIVGYVNFKDIVAQMRLAPHAPSLAAILRPLTSFAETVPISQVLEVLMREHTHIALVRSETGRIVGLVTLEDIIEELIGEIEDEHSRLPTHVTSSEAGWIVGGGIPLDRLRAVTGIDLAADPPSTPAATLNEWVIGHLGRTIRGGDILERDGLRVLVRKIRRQHVQEAQLTRCPSATVDDTHA